MTGARWRWKLHKRNRVELERALMTTEDEERARISEKNSMLMCNTYTTNGEG